MVEIVGYYTNNACIKGAPYPLDEPTVTQYAVQEKAGAVYFVAPPFNPEQIETRSISTDEAAQPKVEVNGHNIKIQEGDKAYHFKFRKFDMRRLIETDRDSLNFFDYSICYEKGRCERVEYSTYNLNEIYALLLKGKNSLPAFHLSYLYFDLQRKMARAEISPEYYTARDKERNYKGILTLQGRHALMSEGTIEQIYQILVKTRGVSHAPEIELKLREYEQGVSFPPGNFLIGTLVMYGEKGVIAETYHEMMGHGTERVLSAQHLTKGEALTQQLKARSIQAVDLNYFGEERVYEISNQQGEPVSYYIIKKDSLLRLFSEYNYLPKAEGFPQFEAIGHPQDGWSELRASTLAIVMTFRQEFLQNYSKLSADDKALAKEVVKLALESINENYKFLIDK